VHRIVRRIKVKDQPTGWMLVRGNETLHQHLVDNPSRVTVLPVLPGTLLPNPPLDL
jgi:hypothetical protein